MTRPSSFIPHQQHARKARGTTRTTLGAADFLRTHEKMAALLPTIARMAALQKDCASILPDIFQACTVLQFESDCLVFSTPNAALAAKLKQRLPKLQEALLKRGWQVSAIRLKVQVEQKNEKPIPVKNLHLPQQAIFALSELDSTLDETPRNAALKAALNSLISKHDQR